MKLALISLGLLTRILVVGLGIVLLLVFAIGSMALGDLPGDNEATMAAQEVIQNHFGSEDCPTVNVVVRLVGGDGSIKAVCSNGQDFRVIGDFAFHCSGMRAC